MAAHLQKRAPAEACLTLTLTLDIDIDMQVHMFENPYHGRQLREWGLTPETAFTCAFMCALLSCS